MHNSSAKLFIKLWNKSYKLSINTTYILLSQSKWPTLYVTKSHDLCVNETQRDPYTSFTWLAAICGLFATGHPDKHSPRVYFCQFQCHNTHPLRLRRVLSFDFYLIFYLLWIIQRIGICVLQSNKSGSNKWS